jgi:MFS family permease
MSSTSSTSSGGAGTSERRNAALASFVGSTVEYYDFLLYTVGAALVFPHVFFPDLAPGVGTIASFGTLAAGYFARPIGAVVCGHFGDRLGRKGLLVLTMVLMGVGSMLIGLLPSYDRIGLAAPVLLVLLRIVQGFASGGEWGGSVLIATEAAPGRRGLFGGFTQAGGPAGSLLATVFMTAMSRLPEDQFLSWGWRVPFLCSALLVVAGLVVRLRLRESPEFTHARAAQRTVAAPLATVLTKYPRALVLAVLAGLAGLLVQGLMATYMLSYAKGIGYATSSALDIKIVMTVGNLVGILFFAWLSDIVGKRRMLLAGSALLLVVPFPFFAVVNAGSTLGYGLAMTAMYTVVHPLVYAPLAGLFSEIFPANVRYTGTALTYQLSSVLGSGLGPLAASALLAAAGGGDHSEYIALMMTGVALLTMVGIVASRRSATSPVAVAVEA